jgi:NADH-quinone oxidoreductase subunit E
MAQELAELGTIADEYQGDRSAWTQELAELGTIASEYQGDRSALIQVLLEIQRQNRWLPKEALKQVSQNLGAPLTQIYHIATFYKAFSLKPKGRHSVTVCLGTACQVRGAPRLLDKVTETLKIKDGETSEDMQFSLDTVRCLGCCALGPVMVVDGEYYGKPTAKEVEQITSAKAIES